MATIGKQAGEKLHGPLYTFDANEGVFTATEVFDVGGKIAHGTNYKVGTLSAPLTKGDLVKIDTAADNRVQKVAAADGAAAPLAGLVVDSPLGDPETGRKVLVQMLAENDILVIKASGALARGAKVMVAALDATAPHGATFIADAAGFGFVLNSCADGELTRLWLPRKA